jgi:hypothetical protein
VARRQNLDRQFHTDDAHAHSQLINNRDEFNLKPKADDDQMMGRNDEDVKTNPIAIASESRQTD